MERHMKGFLREGKTAIKGYIVRISLEGKKKNSKKQSKTHTSKLSQKNTPTLHGINVILSKQGLPPEGCQFPSISVPHPSSQLLFCEVDSVAG